MTEKPDIIEGSGRLLESLEWVFIEKDDVDLGDVEDVLSGGGATVTVDRRALKLIYKMLKALREEVLRLRDQQLLS